MPARGVSGVSLRDFFSAVLRGLGAPVSENNLRKLGAVARVEGHGGDYNPFNYVGGSQYPKFNSVGVRNYPDAATGVAMTVKLLSQNNTGMLRANLMADDNTWNNWIANVRNFYRSWGGDFPSVTDNNARAKLDEVVDGPPSSLAGAGGGGPVPGFDSGSWQQAQESAFQAWLRTQGTNQQQIIDQLRQNQQGGLAAWGNYLPNAPVPVQEYVGFLAKLDRGQQDASLARLGVQQANPGAPPPNAAPSPELTNLLGSLGVQYPNAPQPTPALLAFLNGLGMSLQTAQDLKTRAIQRIGASMSDAMADIDRTSGRTKQNITGDLVRRGVLSSGEANTRYARQAEDVAASKRDVQRTGAQSKETAVDAYTQARDAARQQALDRVIGAEQDQATASATARAQAEYAKQQQDLAELNYARENAARQDALRQQTAAYANQGATV